MKRFQNESIYQKNFEACKNSWKKINIPYSLSTYILIIEKAFPGLIKKKEGSFWLVVGGQEVGSLSGIL